MNKRIFSVVMLLLMCFGVTSLLAACEKSAADVNVEVKADIKNTEYNYHTQLYDVNIEVNVLNHDEGKVINRIDYTVYFYDSVGTFLGSHTAYSEEVINPNTHSSFSVSFDGIKGFSIQPESVYAVPVSVQIASVEDEADPMKWIYLSIALVLTVLLIIASAGCILNEEFGSLIALVFVFGIPALLSWILFFSAWLGNL
jgi:uncharacterized protein YcfL